MGLILGVVVVAGIILFLLVCCYALFKQLLGAIERVLSGTLSEPIIGRSVLARRTRNAISSLVRQITELKSRAEVERSNLSAILESINEGVFLLDNERHITLVNESALRIFSIESSPTGRALVEVLRSPQIEMLVKQAIIEKSRKSREILHETRSREGYSKRHLAVSVAPVKGEGVSPSTVVVVHDVTEIRRLEAIRKEFIVNVSHEIRTPLAIINGFLETLLEGAVDDPELAKSFLETMSRHGNRLNLLIEDLLTISRFEFGCERLQIAPVYIHEILTNVVRQLEPRIRSVGVNIILNVPTDLPHIPADGFRIEQLFFNLLDNALKYAKSTNPTVSFKAFCEGDEMVVDVSDNGPGIPIHDQPHVFERFYRIHKDRSRDAGGTGLGLSIVRHIALVHGGNVSLYSVPGEGCKFTVRLPLRGPNAQKPNSNGANVSSSLEK